LQLIDQKIWKKRKRKVIENFSSQLMILLIGTFAIYVLIFEVHDQDPIFVVGETEYEASKEGRNLAYRFQVWLCWLLSVLGQEGLFK